MPAPTRFAVLCLARTGSSHLVALLDSHPQIRCFGEILNLTHPKAAPVASLVEAATDDPIAHLREVLAGGGPELARGFKLPANSLREHPEIVDWLRAQHDLRLIRLVRENHLALLLSRRLLRATFVSQSTDGSYGSTTVEIDPAGAIRALERIEEEEAELDALAAGHPAHRVSYEELVAGAKAERALAGVQRFLGVEPRQLSSPYGRLRQRGFAESIANWEELAAALRPTRFASMLAE